MNEENLLIELKKYITEGSFKLKWPRSADKFTRMSVFIVLIQLFRQIQRLCISQTEDKISSDYNLCLHPHIEVPIKIESHIGDKLREIVDMVIANISAELQQRLQIGVSERDGEERQISKVAEKLEQIPFEGKISYDGWICAKPGCELKENLWLNLSDGVIMCGRYAPMSAVKGNGHAKTHYEETGYPLVIKLSTISDGDGDIYSYSEDALVRDPLLAKHLAHFGLSKNKFNKTEDTTIVGSKRELPFRAHNYLAKNRITSLYKNRKNIKKRVIDDVEVYKKNIEVFKKNISKMFQLLEDFTDL
ncbi:unnamed protein product [Meloidogyne enterolobii]|uniref:Uncharacterized protein n=1 Tax=Meloidogyne enterolobii TaxID=390850 RepID=A0ACB1AT51_MELEN